MSSPSFSVQELRSKFLRFFESKGHLRFPSGSLIPYDVTGKLDESLLFNGAGMIQFKPYFRGVAQPESKRLTTAQKCLRTGDIDEVGDDSHLTFFEMLGNFSFGDYFKEEAIAYSWEFLTSVDWLSLDPNRLAFTIFETDEEANELWSKWLAKSQIEPAGRIFRMDEVSNYWPAGSYSNGPPGPCGPNSEMFYWNSNSIPAPNPQTYTKEEFLQDEKDGKWLEIWNDVFIGFEWQGEPKDPQKPSSGWRKTGMPDLPFRSIDTGMGLERTVAVLAGKRSVYETDAFLPLIEKLSTLTEVSYLEMPRPYRIVCDHIRSACFCIADSILPSNTGRGYVLRRLIRRAVLQGYRKLKIENLFLHKIATSVSDNFSDHYVELKDRKATISEVLKSEEQLFRKTLEEGVERTGKLFANKNEGVISGEDAFRLYDTYGFPLELTVELATEQGWKVDQDGFEEAMEIARTRSRAGQDRDTVYGNVTGDAVEDLPATTFLGYDSFESESVILLADSQNGKSTAVALDQSPFYASSGGQISDQGEVFVQNQPFKVLEVIKKNGVFIHTVEGDLSSYVGKMIQATVDVMRRQDIQRNHTATHLLHAALHEVIGHHATQAGSYVGPDHLRFDFTHSKPISPDDLKRIESIVNEKVLEDQIVTTYVDIPIAEARERGAMALFGEKYGDKVRMVEIGDFSRELCGGTHVARTGEIGLFKILSESSAASGIRRIEALTGLKSSDYVNSLQKELDSAARQLKTSPKDLVKAIERQQETIKELKQQLEKALASGGESNVQTLKEGEFEVGIVNLGAATSDALQQWVDRFVSGGNHRIGLAASTDDGKCYFAIKIGPLANAKGLHAGNLIREIAKIAGGGGGGNPLFATAGAKDASKIEEALAFGLELIRSKLQMP